MGAISDIGQATDVTVEGPKATPDYGVDATYDSGGYKAQLEDPDFLARVFNHIFEECDRYRDQFAREWLLAYQQYNGNTDTRDKSPWQSNIHVAYPAVAVDTTSGKVAQAMFSTEDDYFEVDPEVSEDDMVTAFCKHSTSWQLRKSEGKDPIKDATKDSLICGNGYIKVHFQRELEAVTNIEWKMPEPITVFGREVIPPGGKYEFKAGERAVSKLRLDCPIPVNVWKDPTGKNRFIIERVTRTLSDLWALCEDEKDPATGEVIRPAVYDKDVVRRIRPGTHDSKRFIEEATIRRDMANMSGTRPQQTVDVYEFWGDMVDPNTGVVLFKNIFATFVDRRWCIRKPQKNPFLHAKIPYIAIHCKRLPHQTYGYGILQQNSRVQEAINRFWNIMLDKGQLSVPMIAYDPTAFRNPRDMAGDNPLMRPGKAFALKPGRIQGGQQNAMIPVVNFPPITEWDVMLNDRLAMIHQMSSGVGEFSNPSSQDTKRKTKEEVQAKVSATESVYNDAAVYIEESAMGPLLRMIYETMLQYEDAYDDQTLLRAFGDQPEAAQFLQQVKSWSPEERWQNLRLDTEFRAVGITNQLTRQSQMEDRQAFLQIAGLYPQMMQRVDWNFLLNDFAKLTKFPRAAILPPEAAMAQGQDTAAISQANTPPGAPPQAPPQQQNAHNQTANVQGEAARGVPVPNRPQ